MSVLKSYTILIIINSWWIDYLSLENLWCRTGNDRPGLGDWGFNPFIITVVDRCHFKEYNICMVCWIHLMCKSCQLSTHKTCHVKLNWMLFMLDWSRGKFNITWQWYIFWIFILKDKTCANIYDKHSLTCWSLNRNPWIKVMYVDNYVPFTLIWKPFLVLVLCIIMMCFLVCIQCGLVSSVYSVYLMFHSWAYKLCI